MENIFYTTIKTPVGYLELKTNKDSLLSISFTNFQSPQSAYQPFILHETAKQIHEYFSGTRKIFCLKTEPAGTDFQLKVWEQVMKVEFGETASYLDIALQTGSKNNTRAVGLANGKNPIPIVIPCHRIIGVNGKLTGYAGGLERKRWLLQHEQSFSIKKNLLF
jgi:methylated-DNA-[protein]-cysteine S-methyltransferase